MYLIFVGTSKIYKLEIEVAARCSALVAYLRHQGRWPRHLDNRLPNNPNHIGIVPVVLNNETRHPCVINIDLNGLSALVLHVSGQEIPHVSESDVSHPKIVGLTFVTTIRGHVRNYGIQRTVHGRAEHWTGSCG